MLVELPSAHEVGALVIEYASGNVKQEFKWDISGPVTAASVPRFCAFYTDCVHRVEPVTAGLRVVAQFDILIDRENFYCGEGYYQRGVVDISDLESRIVSATNTPLLEKICSSLLEKVTADTSIAIPLFHLYRQTSVLYEYLKGPDLALYDALKGAFDIELAAVNITNAIHDEKWLGILDSSKQLFACSL